MTTYFVTGGSGSFGRAFIRTLLQRNLADRVVSVSRNAEMRYRLEQEIPDPRLLVVPGDVRQLKDLRAAYVGPIDVLVHAAAEKFVPTGESHEHYVHSINVDGAENVIQFARERGVRRVVALSTDKACHPTTRYGESKLQAEAIFVAANERGPTRFSVVRYGNVAGSAGSVILLFIKQREKGRLTVTDLRMTRYWMSLSDDADIRVFQEPDRQPVMSAVGLVLYALTRSAGGEVWIPIIPSGTIANLADEIGRDCEIAETGIRASEKLHEQLVDVSESNRCWRTADGVLVLMPTSADVPSVAAVRVPAGFSYSSDQDPQPIRVELENNVRVSVIGCGSIGTRHARNLKALGVDVHVADADPLRQSALIEELDASPVNGRLPDALMICTPAVTHGTVARDWLARGFRGPLFVEKPIATTLEDATVFETWPSPVVQVGYNWPFFHGMARLKLDAPKCSAWTCETTLAQWPGRSYASPLLECSHELALAYWMNGPGVVMQAIRRPSGGLSLTVQHASGYDSSFWINVCAPRQFRRGSVGSASYEWDGDPFEIEDSYRTELAHFLDCVRAGAVPRCSVRMGIAVVEWCLEAERMMEVLA